MKRLAAGLLVLVSLMIVAVQTCGEHSRTVHDSNLEKILFGNDSYSLGKSKDIKDAIKALKYASFLCLDQFNHQGAIELQGLQDYGVVNIPGNISDINFTYNSLHREFTHRGWDYYYPVDMAHWGIRKRILQDTVNRVFGFGFFSGSSFGWDHYDERCNSLAAVIYYVHVLTDHLENKQFKPLVIPLSRPNEPQNIIDELKKHFEVLFKDFKGESVYTTLINDMMIVKSEANNIQAGAGLNTQDKLDAYYNYCQHVMGILNDGVHLLLHKCDFFTNKFPI